MEKPDMYNDTRIETDFTFSILPHWLLEGGVGTAEIALYAVIMRRTGNGVGEWPTVDQMAADMNRTVSTVNRTLANLRQLGILTVTGRAPNAHHKLSLDRPAGLK